MTHISKSSVYIIFVSLFSTPLLYITVVTARLVIPETGNEIKKSKPPGIKVEERLFPVTVTVTLFTRK